MLGVDLWNGSQSQLSAFRRVTGVDFPLLQRAGTGGIPWGLGVENIVVVDREGIIHAVIDIADRRRINEAVEFLLTPVPAPMSRLSRSTLDFGATAIIGTDVSIVLTVENTGDALLQVTDITSDTPEIQFDQTTFTVQPGEREDVTVTLSSTDVGTVFGRVTVTTNDRTWTLLVDRITIEPLPPPAIALPVSTLDFGTIEVGRSGSLVLQIRNDGSSSLSVTDLMTDIPGVRFSTRSLTVAAGETATVSVILDVDAEGPIGGTVDVFSDDPDQGILSISVSATAIVVVADSRADFDRSGVIDFTDFIGFASAFGTSDPSYDIDENGLVDFGDFIVFAQNFGRTVN